MEFYKSPQWDVVRIQKQSTKHLKVSLKNLMDDSYMNKITRLKGIALLFVLSQKPEDLRWCQYIVLRRVLLRQTENVIAVLAPGTETVGTEGRPPPLGEIAGTWLAAWWQPSRISNKSIRSGARSPQNAASPTESHHDPYPELALETRF